MDGHVSPAAAAEPDPIEGLRETLLTIRPGADFGLLQRAYHVSAQCHRGQYRKSGDPYITHPVAVATILAGPLLVVVSEDVCRSGGMDLGPGPHRISVDVGGQHRDGWAFVPGRQESAAGKIRLLGSATDQKGCSR
jgi:hypothetical protein